ncbi:MAG: hypothetical protein ACYCW6_06300 [Candidatus Xenobia bacterium]
MIILLAVTAAFSLANISLLDLQSSQTIDAQRTARNLADSCIAITIQHLRADATFGTNRLPTDTCQVSYSNGSAYATFNPQAAAAQNIPWSTNLLQSDTAGSGWHGRSIPSHGCHIVAQGICNSHRVLVESIVTMPPFPYTIAATGTVASLGPLLVAAVDPASQASAQANIQSNNLLPGNLVSNSAQAQALDLSACHVTGNVQAVGGIQLARGSQVDGSVQPDSDPVPMPSIDVQGMVTSASNDANLTAITQNPIGNPKMPAGFYSYTGNLVVNGDLNLSQTVMYVNGSLHVTGGIKGTGALIVGGTTTVDRTSQMATDDMAAIISGDTVTLNGAGSGASSFQGLIYTAGDFKAQGITLIGSFVANSGNNGNVQLQDVAAVQDTSVTHIVFGTSQIVTSQTYANYLNFTAPQNATYKSSWFGLDSSSTPAVAGGQFQGVGSSPGPVAIGIQVLSGPPEQIVLNGKTFLKSDQSGISNYLQSVVQSSQPPPSDQSSSGHGWLELFGFSFSSHSSSPPPTLTVSQQQDQVTAALGAISTVQPTVTKVTTQTKVVNVNQHAFDFNMNQFIALEDTFRVLYQAEMDPDHVK